MTLHVLCFEAETRDHVQKVNVRLQILFTIAGKAIFPSCCSCTWTPTNYIQVNLYVNRLIARFFTVTPFLMGSGKSTFWTFFYPRFLTSVSQTVWGPIHTGWGRKLSNKIAHFKNDLELPWEVSLTVLTQISAFFFRSNDFQITCFKFRGIAYFVPKIFQVNLMKWSSAPKYHNRSSVWALCGVLVVQQ